MENEDYKILWDFSVQTVHVIGARRPDLIVIDKKERSYRIIDFVEFLEIAGLRRGRKIR